MRMVDSLMTTVTNSDIRSTKRTARKRSMAIHFSGVLSQSTSLSNHWLGLGIPLISPGIIQLRKGVLNGLITWGVYFQRCLIKSDIKKLYGNKLTKMKLKTLMRNVS